MEELLKTKELEDLQKSFSDSGSKLNATSLWAHKEHIDSTERVGWFSAATISLSFTLVGYLLSKPEILEILKQDFLFIKVIDILIIAWISLGISLLASLLTRRLHATHVQYSDLFHWSSKGKQLREKMIELMDIDLSNIIFTDANDPAHAKANLTESKKDYEETETISNKKRNFWRMASNLTQASVYLGTFLGIILLIVFLVLIMGKII